MTASGRKGAKSATDVKRIPGSAFSLSTFADILQFGDEDIGRSIGIYAPTSVPEEAREQAENYLGITVLMVHTDLVLSCNDQMKGTDSVPPRSGQAPRLHWRGPAVVVGGGHRGSDRDENWGN